MDNTMVKAEKNIHYDIGWAWTLTFSAGITTATLLLLMHMHLIIAQSFST